MSIVNSFNVTVNEKTKVSQDPPEFFQYDNVLFQVTIYDGDVLLPLLAGYRYYLTSVKPNGEVVMRNGTASNGVISFQLGPSEMANPGKVKGIVQVLDSDNTRVSMAEFHYNVLSDPSYTGTPATDHSLIELRDAELQEMLAKTEDYSTAKGGFASLTERLNSMDVKFSNNKVAFGNVLDFGATGTGSNNDTNAIQAVLDIAKTSGAVHCLIPDGVYWITSRLTIYKNTRITMGKNAKLLRKGNVHFFINGTSTDNFTGYTGNGNILIEGGILESNLAEFNTNLNGFQLARGENIVLRDVEIRNIRGGHAVDMNACKNVLFDHCRFLGYNDDNGNSNFREAIQIADHVQAGFGTFGAFDGEICRNVIVQNCYFGASDTQPAYPTGVGHHGSYYNKWTSNIQINNCTFDGMLYAGIRVFKYRDVIISQNYFTDCYAGVKISNPDGTGVDDGGVPQSAINVLIAENLFIGTKTHNVYAYGWEKSGVVGWVESIRILNNIMENQLGLSATDNMSFQFVKNLLISGNVTRGCSRNISIYYANTVRINHNDCQNATYEFFYSSEPSGFTGLGYTKDFYITNNRIDTCGRAGINLNTVDGFEVSNNEVINPAIETDNTRSGIFVGVTSKNGRVMGNKVRKAAAGNQNKYGIEVSATCSNVQTFNNDVDGKTGRVLNSSTSGFDGLYVNNPTGTANRTIVSTVANGNTNVTVTAANTVCSAHVDLTAYGFAATPNIIATPVTSVPQSVRVSINNASATGFDINVYRTDGAVNTGVNWTASNNS